MGLAPGFNGPSPLVIATRNPGKLREFRRLLAHGPWRLLSLDDAGFDGDLDEPGPGYVENARAKAETVTERIGLPALGDDSGIEIPAFDGWPGPVSARWLGGDATDADRLHGLLRKVEADAGGDTRARYVAVLCLARPARPSIVIRETCDGSIVTPVGPGGFGYDPAFFSLDLEATFGQVPADEKDVVSHRGRAVAAFRAERVPSGSGAVVLPLVPSASMTRSLLDVGSAALTEVLTVEVLRPDGEELGTGWLFDDRGDIVTNAHVVEGSIGIRIRDRRARSHVGVVMGSDRVSDVAVIRSTDGLSGSALPIAPTGELKVPMAVATVAAGRATDHKDVTIEQLVSLHQSVSVRDGAPVEPTRTDPSSLYQDMMTLRGEAIYPGNSGGPVLDGEGRVIGIVTLKNRVTPEAYAIPIQRVLLELRTFAGRDVVH